ncbi:uncharacterized protein HMPREF1541_07402 [Cyphellophora europaea CBS 101466]|uniref:Histone deacetylation protein Rxt3 n=1 Tax=Cyphellophora europaea (strain CBS 101466) TaxID=1220924 RepID=W2RPX2_CYPE1|nr:uncharacterized protein HMPREF1541_07402 [Cyphellophora europaea CBS 101466]ETN37779.1 hypothetical protein HMPREF1541_07402 [Cyphellophora europaea CBS 101466]
MSPPSYPPKSNPTEYSYKPRSTTPDRLGDYNQNRYRSGSGSMMQRPSPFTEISSAIDRQQPRYSETTQFGPQMPQRDEATERARRTSISGILQRPESAPQRPTMNGNPIPPNPLPRPESATPSMNGDPFSAPKAPSDRPGPLGGSYDTRPPPFSNRPPTAQPISFKEVRPFEKRDSQSSSPELRRVQPNGAERSFGSILNDGLGSQGMARQDSQLSQSSAFGGRYGPRAFSPFAPSVASQSMSVTSGPAEEQVRKGSDELSHRAILGLATESRRGRYSPVPQAVQGAQAQTPVPETGIKTEQGRVFAGLGGGLGASSTGPTSTPGGLSSSPLKDGTTRLSEENLMKMSRSTSGMGKRARKFDDELRAESDVGGAGKKGRKRSKYAHSYKIDLEDNARRGTPLSNSIQRTDSPLNVTSQPTQLSHHHHMPRQTDQRLLYKPKKTIRISSILTAAKRMPRKHLGTFKYDPAVSNPVTTKLGADKFDVSVRPNALPSFDGPDHVNCTYSIRVPKLWLQERERRMICRENFLWGSGIYTDDSDILAAAMHSGFIKSVPPEGVDRSLLDEIAKAQNTKIEGLVDPPEKPLVPEQDKDAVVTCVVLPSLEQYAGSARYGITSREWPDEKKGSVHDGVSFAVLKVEFVAGGVEARRMGRTGKERRERLRKELDDRKKGQERMKEMIEQMKSRMRRLGKVQRRTNGEHVRKELAGKAAMGSFKEKIRVEEQRQQQQKEKEKEQTLHASLDVGQAPGEWLQQLETSAVDA